MAKIRLEIITPEKKAYEADVNDVVVPGALGEFDVLPGHDNFLALIQPGELRVTIDGDTRFLAIGSGFAEVTGDYVRILTDMALEESQIDENVVEKALESARKALAEAPANSEEAERLMAMIQKSMAQLQLKRRKRV